MTPSRWLTTLGCAAALAALAPPAQAAITRTELAGNSLAQYPFFEYVKAINVNATVEVAIDPTRFPGVVGQTCDIYVVGAKSVAQWAGDVSLSDVTLGGAQTENFGGATIQNNTFQVAAPAELSASAGLGLGVGYDVVLDCDQDGALGDGDFIDGLSDEAGFYAVHDTTAAGPLGVTEVLYNIAPAVGASFGIPATRLAENLYYPTNVASMGKLPVIIVSHGNGHNYQWYDHIGNHMASYGYVVMSHDNDTVPGVETAATTTLGHTDAFIDQVQAGAIAAGALVGHLDTSRITWIGHSRGGEGVAIGYDRLFDGSHTPTHFSRSDIRLISSMLPTDFQGTGITEPHDANYHLWTAAGDSDVNGSAGCDLCQTFHIHDRATGYRQSTVVQGTGHGWFHDEDAAGAAFTGPCPIGPPDGLTHLIQLGHFLPLIKHYVEGNVPALDFLTRQYESFRPIGVPTANPCVVVTHEYRNGSPTGNFMIDDYQTQPGTGTSSSGGAVAFDVQNLTEGRLDDNNGDFVFGAGDPFNGATQASATDSSRGVVFDWTNQDRFYEWEIVAGERDFTDNVYLAFRAAQGTQHPNTLAVLGDLTFSVTLRDAGGTSSSINIGAYGGGLEQPYQRGGGWHNEMEAVRIRLTDFLNNGSGLDLSQIVAVRLDVGPSWGSAVGRIVVDEVMLTNYVPPLAPPAPQIQVPGPLDLGDVCVGSVGAATLDVCNTGKADLIVYGVASSDPEFSVTAPLAGYPVTISPDFCFPFQARFAPGAPGPDSATLTISSNDPNNPLFDVDAAGNGTEQNVVVTGSGDFGVTSAWTPAEETFTVCNLGACDLDVTGAAINCTDFTLIGNPFPATIPAGACVDLVVGFTPALPGPKSCQLTVTSDDPDTPVVARTLTARTPPRFSLHAGLVDPNGALAAIADQGSTLNLDFVYPFTTQLAWDVRLGYSRFDGQPGLPDVGVGNLAANIKFTVNPAAPVRFFLNGGLGIYHFDPGSFEGGGNLGLGLNVPVGPRFDFEATYNYHNAFTAAPNREFNQFQLGFLVSF